MKKRFFSIILAGIMTTSCFEYVATPKHTIYAQNDAVPTINYGEGNGNAATVKWDVPINESSIFMKEDFEDVGLDYSIGLEDQVTQYKNGVYYDSYGNIRANDDPVKNSLKIIPNVGYNGSKGAIAQKTAPRGGWSYNWRSYLEQPNGYSDSSYYRFKKFVPLKADKPAIVRFRAKGEGKFQVRLIGDYSGNAYPSNDVTWAEDLSPEELIKRLESGIRIKINNPKEIVYTDLGITTAPCYTYDCNFYYCRGTFDKEGEQWYFTPRYWHGALGGSGRPNQSVAGSNRANVGTKNGQPINVLHYLSNACVQTELSTDNWKFYSMNIKIPNTKENIDTGCYFQLDNYFTTTTELAVDDITVAYAPLSRVYRNGVLVNEDYTTEYTDTAAKDTKAPNTPSSFKGTINNGKLDLSWQDSTDNGTSYTYTISSVDENGTESSKSQPKVVNVTTGVDHYEIYEGDTLKAKTTSTDYTVSSYENANNISICQR